VLLELLRRRRVELAERWFEEALAAYPPRTVDVWRRERDRFANPVGHALREGTRAVLDTLLDGGGPAAVRAGLVEILRIRAVQEMPPATAVAFVFRLKAVVRAEASGLLQHAAVRPELAELERAIDEVALAAFDLYVENRERLVELRIAELKRNIPWAVARAELAAVGSALPQEGHG
jgi:hypothetical protein